MAKFKDFLLQCGRVFRISRKPTGEEVKQVAKVSALGIFLIGMIGFIITMVFLLVF
jgi:protein transport protein SEC61 subunit gamma and related proteins